MHAISKHPGLPAVSAPAGAELQREYRTRALPRGMRPWSHDRAAPYPVQFTGGADRRGSLRATVACLGTQSLLTSAKKNAPDHPHTNAGDGVAMNQQAQPDILRTT